MSTLQLSMLDRFVEFGNLFFNVKDSGREFKYDLQYEYTMQDPVNRFFLENEDKMLVFNKYFQIIIDFITSIFSRKEKYGCIRTNNKSSFRINNDNLSKSLSSQDVIRRNVRNRLMKTISIEKQSIENTINKKGGVGVYYFKLLITGIKTIRFSYRKKQKIVKNRYMGDLQ